MAEDFRLTERADQFFSRIARMTGVSKTGGLHLDVEPGGCSGYSISFRPAPAPASADEIYVYPQFRLFMDAASHEHIKGGTLDFIESQYESGLRLQHPQAVRTCASANAHPQVNFTFRACSPFSQRQSTSTTHNEVRI